MFGWLRRLFRIEDDGHDDFFEMVDTLNANAHGGKPERIERTLGSLPVRSGALWLADPQRYAPLVVPNVPDTAASISARLWKYPSGAETVVGFRLEFDVASEVDSRRVVGEVGIDSAKLVVADKAGIDAHWTEVGPERTGVIGTAPDDAVLQLLVKKFKLKARRVNPVRAEVIGPVSEELEKKIDEYLQTIPKYAAYSFCHFRVETNNSFDRCNRLRLPWAFLPVGNGPDPLMFVCGTGRGDGRYQVYGDFAGDVLKRLSITFVDDPPS